MPKRSGKKYPVAKQKIPKGMGNKKTTKKAKK